MSGEVSCSYDVGGGGALTIQVSSIVTTSATGTAVGGNFSEPVPREDLGAGTGWAAWLSMSSFSTL